MNSQEATEKQVIQSKKHRGRPRTSKAVMELCAKIVDEYHFYLPAYYSSEIIQELDRMGYEYDPLAIRRKIHSVIQKKAGDIGIAKAIAEVGKRYKAEFEQLKQEIE